MELPTPDRPTSSPGISYIRTPASSPRRVCVPSEENTTFLGTTTSTPLMERPSLPSEMQSSRESLARTLLSPPNSFEKLKGCMWRGCRSTGLRFLPLGVGLNTSNAITFPLKRGGRDRLVSPLDALGIARIFKAIRGWLWWEIGLLKPKPGQR